jgi:hypothetical protein
VVACGIDQRCLPDRIIWMCETAASRNVSKCTRRYKNRERSNRRTARKL